MKKQKTWVVLTVLASLLAGCSSGTAGTAATDGSTSAPATVAQATAVTKIVTKPETKPATKPETKPQTKPETKPATKPETKPATKPETKPATKPETKPQTKPETKPATKPEPTNPIDPDDIRTGHAYDTYTVRDWTWNASAADYYPDNKLVFLTFDDGPSRTVTPAVLDVLEKNDVPATFFYYTSGDLNAHSQTVKRTAGGGHAIAIHTDSHDYSLLYPKRKADVSAILRDADRASSKIRGILGTSWTPTVYRFPGGSFSWTGSDSAKKAMRQAKEALADKGLIYLDWNAMSGDSDTSNKDKSAAGLVKFTIKQTESAFGHVIVVLMHDAEHSRNTPKALQGIIDYFKEEGYEFGTLK